MCVPGLATCEQCCHPPILGFHAGAEPAVRPLLSALKTSYYRQLITMSRAVDDRERFLLDLEFVNALASPQYLQREPLHHQNALTCNRFSSSR